MKRIVVLLTVFLLVFACGSKKKAAAKKAKHKIETVHKPLKVVKEEKADLPKTTSPVTHKTIQYISDYKDIAMQEMRIYNIPASITLAQGILESGSGRGRLVLKANNHFGIKCHNWKGKKVYYDDDKKNECFRKYKSSETSFRDHSEFLAARKRYASLFKLRKSDYKAWAKGLRKAGYATDKKYPQKLISIIERYELYAYDKEVLGKKYRVTKVENITHKIVKGDTLYSLSRHYNTTVEAIKKTNNLTSNDLKIGEILIIKSN